jgi:hypothetical protein
MDRDCQDKEKDEGGRMKDERQAAFHSAFRLPPADLLVS